jgi:hypothetical protein
VRQSSIGGQANEAGSLHRAGVAAYLAAHGLAGAAVEAAGYAEGGPHPVSVALESGDAVDDIRCGLSDGTLLFAQAKRECGLDRQFRSTVAQWAAQVPTLREGDRIALAAGRVKGMIRALGPALARRRSMYESDTGHRPPSWHWFHGHAVANAQIQMQLRVRMRRMLLRLRTTEDRSPYPCHAAEQEPGPDRQAAQRCRSGR